LNKTKTILITIAAISLFFLFSSAFAWQIDGQTIIEENQYAKIEVTPHTASSPTGEQEQTFKLTYKGQNRVEGIKAVYYFSQQPQNASIEKWIEPEYGLVEKSVEFNTVEYEWRQEESGNPTNPYKITVYYNRDLNNGSSEEVPVWIHETKNSEDCGAGMKCFYWDETEQVSGGYWLNINGKFSSLGEVAIGGENYYYYYSQDFALNPGQEITWRIKYKTEAKTGKWNLAFIKGEANCLIQDNCQKKWLIDPWWNSEYNYKKQIQFPSQTITQHKTIQLEWSNNEFANASSDDLNDLRIVDDSTNTEIERECTGKRQDGNCFFRLPRTINGATENQIMAYYGNSDATGPAYYGLDANAIGFEDDEAVTGTENYGTIVETEAFRGIHSYEIDGEAWLNGFQITDVLNDTQSADYNYSAWFKITSHSTDGYVHRFDLQTAATGDICTIGVRSYGTYSRWRDQDAAVYYGPNVALDTWYNFQLYHPNGDSKCYVTIRLEDGTDIVNWVNNATTSTDAGILAIEGDGPGATNGYWDNSFYGAPVKATGLASQQTPETPTTASGKLRIEADLNVTKKLYVTQDANFFGNVKIEGTLFGGSPVKMKGGINVEGGITSDDYRYAQKGKQISLISQIKNMLETIQKLFTWNTKQDQRITALENELCKYNKNYSWCNQN